MTEHLLENLTLLIGLGVAAQWLAWRLRLPSILLLLISGFIAGPVTGWLDPDELLGPWLMPIVSLSVAIILFEGGLTLRLAELRAIGRVVRNLISIGAVATWVVAGGAAHLILGWDLALAALVGALLVVTGPTVIMPLLRHVQPGKTVASALKWEGILSDPIGALLALIVFEAILAKEIEAVPALAVLSFSKTLIVGLFLGVIGARLLLVFFRRHWIPDYLQNPVSLAAVVSVFTAANYLQEESGLLAVTVLGIALANQKGVSIRHIAEFKENLRVLLLSGLFILLAARINLDEVNQLSWRGSLLFLLVLLFVARPLGVLVSTGGSELTWRERVFLGAIAPRGIVAAAVASIFALRLAEEGHPRSAELVPLTFLVIVGTVVVYGLAAAPLGRWLGISKPNPQGVLMVGAHSWARTIAKVLQGEGISVLVVDTNRQNVAAARLEGLPNYFGSILSEHAREELDLTGLGRLMALTFNSEVNALACLHFVEFFGRSEVYHLATHQDQMRRSESVSPELQGRTLFGEHATFAVLESFFDQGATIKKTGLTAEFDFDAFRQRWGDRALPLFLITAGGNLRIFTRDQPLKPEPDQTLISLVLPQLTPEISASQEAGAREGSGT